MIGARCRLNQAEAARLGLKTKHWRRGELIPYVGKIVGEQEGKWLVLWDGLKYERPLEKGLIELER